MSRLWLPKLSLSKSKSKHSRIAFDYKSLMLVLSRKTSESIIIDHHIKLTVFGIDGKQVSLGIDAPQEISVHRSEVYEKIQAAKVDAETLDKTDKKASD